MDAANGMGYLHTKKLVHGHLDSEKCVIDEQWRLKILGNARDTI